MSNDNYDDEYQVGYCKPPTHSQFKPGQSGNAKGRPPQPKTDVMQSFKENFLIKEKVKVNGKVQELAGVDMFFMKWKELLLKNDKHARKDFVQFISAMKLQDRFVDIDFD